MPCLRGKGRVQTQKMANFEEIADNLKVELRLRGFSERTVSTYVYANLKFLENVKKEPEEVSEQDIKKYFAYLMSVRKLAPTSIILIKAALKFYYDGLLNKRIVNIKSPKTAKKLPSVLSREEVKRLIEAADSTRSRLLMVLLYSSGLRLSEALNLRWGNIERNGKMGWVRGGKGGKDRMFIVSNAFLDLISKENLSGTDDEFIFQKDGKQLSPRNAQRIIKSAAFRAGITKNVHPHTLRHCFATHLLESGVGIRQIQELLGHSNLQTTQIYTSVSTEELKKIKSPLDSL